MVQWLRFHLPIHGVWVRPLVRELRSLIPQALPPKKNQNVKQKQYYNKFNQDFKNCQKIFKKRKKKTIKYHPQFLLMRVPAFPSPAHLHPPLTSLTVNPQPRSAPWTPHKYPSPHPWKGLVWPIFSLLALCWRSALKGMEKAGKQHTYESYQSLHLMSYLSIISCPTYIRSPQGKSPAPTCAMENREPRWHWVNGECCRCKVLMGRCE